MSDSAPPTATDADARGEGLAATPVPSDLPFESALEQLESVVDRLEQGELELEAALSAFEQGVRLSRHCAQQLSEAERRIEILVREGDGLVEEPFEAAVEEGDFDDDAADDDPADDEEELES